MGSEAYDAMGFKAKNPMGSEAYDAMGFKA